MTYRALFNLILRWLPVEWTHRFAAVALIVVCRIPGVRPWLKRTRVPHDRALRVDVIGLSFASPLGVAAGMDKDATWFNELSLLGFGSVEVGTVTRDRQKGNPRPRVFRVLRDRALINRMGFPNPGAPKLAKRLRHRDRCAVIGVNVGKSAATELDDAAADYRATIREVAPVCDYLAVNVSSPNTPGLRDLQSIDRLRPLLQELQSELRDTRPDLPLLVKISPDLSNAEIDALAELALELSLDGIVAVNTTEDRSILSAPGETEHVSGGGVSGAPLGVRAVEVLARLYARVGASLTLVSVGGISTADDVWDRILAGASLVQVHTGFVYGGPSWPHRINGELARRVRREGARSIQDLVGSGHDMHPQRDGAPGARMHSGGFAPVTATMLDAPDAVGSTGR